MGGGATGAAPAVTEPGRRVPWDRAIALAGLLGLALLAWVELWRHRSMMATSSAGPGAWHRPDLVMLALMWSVMMVAMMLPSAVPMVLLFAKTQAHRLAPGAATARIGIFVGGYLLVWTAWSMLAAALQWVLQSGLVMSAGLALRSPVTAGLVLALAGAYQITPLKTRCLVHCQSPLGFLLTRWREGPLGALQMGARHGAYCVGCCWALMGLLFVAGVMNLLWVAALSAYVLIEKTALPGPLLSRLVGLALLVWGAALMLAGARG